VGLAADVGSLQRLPKIVGNDSLLRELAFTARRFTAAEAQALGLVSRILPTAAATLGPGGSGCPPPPPPPSSHSPMHHV
jgi:Delta3,5-Delta2,4-dienoyl-CoA isomerase